MKQMSCLFLVDQSLLLMEVMWIKIIEKMMSIQLENRGKKKLNHLKQLFISLYKII